jgi:hypothetical protein
MYKSQKSSIGDLNYLRFVGWSEESNPCFKSYYSPETVRIIQKKVSELTKGIHEEGKTFVVTDEVVVNVMDGIFRNFKPSRGDIYTRNNIPSDGQINLVQSMIDQTIEVITDHIRNEYGMQKANEKLSPWVQLYGDFNPHNLNQTPPIKVRDKRPSTMQFNMNY